MKIIELKPIKDTESEWSAIEALIKKVFRERLFRPILKELMLSEKKISNASEDDLFLALKSGKINYKNGKFIGKFTAKISKILKHYGAIWEPSTKSFKLPFLPSALRDQVQKGAAFYESKMAKISAILSKITPEYIAKHIKVAPFFEKAVWKVEDEFQKSVKNITVAPSLTEKQAAKISEEWQTNMDLWIKNFSKEQIETLRETVKQSIFEGNRYESLIEGIKKSYHVTDKKAKFLARQETKLLMAKFKEAKYTSAGVHEYKWYCVKRPHDKSPNHHTLGNVRYYHAILEGKIFRWDSPPLTNQNPDRRNNPGEDWNCRCFSRPLLRK